MSEQVLQDGAVGLGGQVHGLGCAADVEVVVVVVQQRRRMVHERVVHVHGAAGDAAGRGSDLVRDRAGGPLTDRRMTWGRMAWQSWPETQRHWDE